MAKNKVILFFIWLINSIFVMQEIITNNMSNFTISNNMGNFTISKRWFNAYGVEPTYSWFPLGYVENKLDFQVDLTDEDFGTICMPTGTGKSGEMYKLIINKINSALAQGKRIIINISSPLIKLNQQLSLDMMFVLLELFYNKTSPLYRRLENNMEFFFNSSEANPDYMLFKKTDVKLCPTKISPRNFVKDFDSYVTGNKKVAIICSCNKSLHTYVDYIKEHNIKSQGFELITLMDESHTISDRDFSTSSEDVKVDVKTLCQYSTGVVAVSATPDIKITDIINKYSKHHNKLKFTDDPFFVHVCPKDAINDGLILAPYIDVWRSSYTELNEKMIAEIYADAPTKNPTVPYHKILVNCPIGDKGDEKKVRALYNNLRKKFATKINNKNLRIYVTSYDTGMMSTTGEKFVNMKNFTSSIDNAECDCIVLHVRQMIAGVDISSITQTVMYLSDITETDMRTIIQTCGRCLRIGQGDRVPGQKYAKPIGERLKKFGLCTFVLLDEDNETEEKLRDFFICYYICDNYRFTKHYSNCSGGNETIGHPITLHNNRKFTIENTRFAIDFTNYITENYEKVKRALRTESVESFIENYVNKLNKDKTFMIFIFENRDAVNMMANLLNNIK